MFPVVNAKLSDESVLSFKELLHPGSKDINVLSLKVNQLSKEKELL